MVPLVLDCPAPRPGRSAAMPATPRVVRRRSSRPTSSEAEGLGLAPAAIVRVAAWPLRAVTELADPALAELARDVEEGGPQWARYEARYAEAMAHWHRSLWARTVDDPRFMRALALTNPALAEGLHGRPACPRRNKRARHRETTLYRTLARAVARTEPSGAWVGVTAARWGEARSIAPAPIRHHVAPDLAPLRAMVRALAAEPRYRGRGWLVLNPTLQAQDDGGWLVWAPASDGPAVQRRLRGTPGIQAIVQALAERARWSWPEAAQAVARATGADEARAMQVLAQLREAGVLLGGLAFPGAFSDAWDALATVRASLCPEDARAWARAGAELRTIADDLAVRLPQASVQQVLATMRRAAAVLEALADALGIPCPALPRAPLRCDTAAPWTITLGRSDATRLRATIEAYGRFQDHEGIETALRRTVIRWMLGGRTEVSLAELEPPPAIEATEPGVVTWSSLVEQLGGDRTLAQRVRAGAQRLHDPGPPMRPSASSSAAAGVAGPPLGALRISWSDAQARIPVVHAMGVDATGMFSRVAQLLEPAADDRPLTAWLGERHAQVRRRTGVALVDLAHDHPSPNVLARPALGLSRFDPWQTTDAAPGRALRLSLPPDAELPVVWSDDRSQPMAVLATTAAAIGPDDPCLPALLLSSGRLPALLPGGTTLAHAEELAAPMWSPRVVLPEGSVARPRRSIVRGAELEALLSVRGAQRFARWQRLAARLQWPARLMVRRGVHPPLLVPRDCPLAVEAAFEGAKGPEALVVQEHVAQAWVGVPDDREAADAEPAELHVAELVLPFARRSDPWGTAVDEGRP